MLGNYEPVTSHVCIVSHFDGLYRAVAIVAFQHVLGKLHFGQW